MFTCAIAERNSSGGRTLDWDRKVASSRLTRFTVVSLSKTLHPLLSADSTQEDRPDMTEKLLTGM